MRRRVVSGGGAEQSQLRFDLRESLVAVEQVGVVVADGELEAHAGVEKGPHGADEHVLETIREVPVVADVAEQRDQTERRPLIRAGHLGCHRHRLAASAAIVTDGNEAEPMVGLGPRLPPQRDIRRGAGNEILTREQRPHMPAQQQTRGRRAGCPAGRGE